MERETEPSWGDEVEGCRFSASSPVAVYAPAQPIPLRLRLKNDGKAAVAFFQTDIMQSVRFDVRLPNGMAAPMTLEGKRQSESGENVSVTLEPGKSDDLGVSAVNRYFDMTMNGDYTVTVTRFVQLRDGSERSVKVVSNSCKITVREEGPDPEEAKKAK